MKKILLYGLKIKPENDPRPWTDFGVCITLPASTTEKMAQTIMNRMRETTPGIDIKLVTV